ncbi:hypothetical protein [Kitasatospora sp. NPDC057015]|uniref:hypothetical protein n=1 Tax=Kitasatospora sp. NPDC057015 TaxID=3346001 RepID=UPI00363BC74F
MPELTRWRSAGSSLPIPRGTAYPCGYGHELYAKGRPAPDAEVLVRQVNRDVAEALEHRINVSPADFEELRALEDARLDCMFTVAYRRAIRTEITGHDGGPLEVDTTADELATLIATTDPAGAAAGGER